MMRQFVLAAVLGLCATTAVAQDWRTLPPPAVTPAVIESNPLQGFYSWLGPDIVPVSPPSPDHYIRLGWADLETSEGVYDFSKIDDALASLPPTARIAFGVMPADTCCSGHHGGREVPAYIEAKSTKGFWVKANPGSWKMDRAYIPDWNDPYYLERWRALWAAIGKRFDGNPRIAWIDLRGYGNWGEGHLNGDSAYTWGKLPYDDLKTNLHGAEPGTLATRLAIADAILDAMPHTQMLAMSDDKPVSLHAFHAATTVPVGLRRDSWGATWFEEGLARSSETDGNLSDAQLAELRDRWKVAPFVVESFGWTRVFEVGFDGLTRQVEDYHISSIGNGNFNVEHWSDLTPEQQSALVRAGNRAGYRYVPAQVRYRHDDGCGLRVAITWRNDGVAPAYAPWTVRLWLRQNGTPVALPGDSVLPKVLPGETVDSEACYAAPAGAAGELSLQLVSATGDTMQLPLNTGDKARRYVLGEIAP